MAPHQQLLISRALAAQFFPHTGWGPSLCLYFFVS